MLRCIPRGNTVPYNVARQISNSRFDYKPSQVCFAYEEGDVVDALSNATPGKVRVRAGGHHHEGMCSGEDVLMLDVSHLDHVEVDEAAGTVRVGPGAKLGDIYDAVLPKGFLFPGGACRDVHVGGLVQGGGWGLFARALGLTCDSLEEFRMVVWSDEKNAYEPTRVRGWVNDPNLELYWAVCGGGGGNFGVATEFLFKIVPFKFSPGPQKKHVTQFSATWEDRSLMRDVLDAWLDKVLPFDDFRLTTFCRLIAPGTEVSDNDKPSLVLGNFIGEWDELKTILDKLLPHMDKASVVPNEVAVWPPTEGVALDLELVTPSLYQAGAPASAADEAPEPAPGLPAPSKLGDTCSGGLFRHKVSSAYPVPNDPRHFPSDARDAILSHVNVTSLGGARRYISLHSLGGFVNPPDSHREEWSCFAYRDKPFLIQYQAWWHNPALDDTCLKWIAAFRDCLYNKKFTEGSFINFPDDEIVKTTDQKELMRPYYGDNLARLMRIKNQYDGKGMFDFPMGIPRK